MAFIYDIQEWWLCMESMVEMKGRKWSYFYQRQSAYEPCKQQGIMFQIGTLGPFCTLEVETNGLIVYNFWVRCCVLGEATVLGSWLRIYCEPKNCKILNSSSLHISLLPFSDIFFLVVLLYKLSIHMDIVRFRPWVGSYNDAWHLLGSCITSSKGKKLDQW